MSMHSYLVVTYIIYREWVDRGNIALKLDIIKA